MMGEIDLPSLKHKLWHTMRDDLKSLVPWFADNDLLLCPTCCRALSFDDFSLEHIIPQQAVADDPAAARTAVPRNERSGMTLLCRKTLVVAKKTQYGQGCNSWKGRYYDRFIRDALRPDFHTREFNSRHHVALLCAGYLGLFRMHGYQVALIPSGAMLRRQFFQPNSLSKEMPLSHGMVLAGGSIEAYDEASHSYWSEPFKVGVERDTAVVMMRNFSMPLPLSRDPTIPIAREIQYAPPRYRLRPDLTTVFDRASTQAGDTAVPHYKSDLHRLNAEAKAMSKAERREMVTEALRTFGEPAARAVAARFRVPFEEIKNGDSQNGAGPDAK